MIFRISPGGICYPSLEGISLQIIATKHTTDENPKWWWIVREIPLCQANLGWWNIVIWTELLFWISFRGVFFFVREIQIGERIDNMIIIYPNMRIFVAGGYKAVYISLYI